MNRSNQQRAFTLIELMVVVAIILMLVAILLPTLDKAQEMTAATVCAANQRQLMLATTAYASDNYNLYPPFRQAITLNWYGAEANGDPPGAKLEDSLLWKYLRDPDVLMCPIFKSLTNENAIRSYVMNWNAGSTTPRSDCNNEGVGAITKVIRPNVFCLFSEENPWKHPVYAGVGINDADLVCDTWPGQDTLATYHFPLADRYREGYPAGFLPQHQDQILDTGVANVVFADGHVDLVDTLMTESVVNNDPADTNYPQNTPYTP